MKVLVLLPVPQLVPPVLLRLQALLALPRPPPPLLLLLLPQHLLQRWLLLSSASQQPHRCWRAGCLEAPAPCGPS